MQPEYIPIPGDLCKYLSRVLLVVGNPYDSAPGFDKWVETIEIDDAVLRNVRCDTLTLIQRVEENIND